MPFSVVLQQGDCFSKGVTPSSVRKGSTPSSVMIPCLTHTGTEYSNNHVAEYVSVPGSYLIATNSGLIYNLFTSPK